MNIISSNISNCILFIYMLYEKKSKLKTFFGEVLSKHLIYVSNSFDWACIFFIFIKFETLNLFRSILLALDSLILGNTFFLCREIRHEDSFIHVLFLCVFLLYHFVMFFGVYFLPLHSMSSTGAVPKTPAPTPSSSFVADAPIQFDLLTPTSQNGGVAPSLPGPPKLVSKACHHACIMSPF